MNTPVRGAYFALRKITHLQSRNREAVPRIHIERVEARLQAACDTAAAADSTHGAWSVVLAVVGARVPEALCAAALQPPRPRAHGPHCARGRAGRDARDERAGRGEERGRVRAGRRERLLEERAQRREHEHRRCEATSRRADKP